MSTPSTLLELNEAVRHLQKALQRVSVAVDQKNTSLQEARRQLDHMIVHLTQLIDHEHDNG